MNKFALYVFCSLFCANTLFAQVIISDDQTTPDSSAMLEVKSTSRGLLPPRLTWTEMNSIVNPARGLMVFCTTTGYYYFNQGTPDAPFWVSSLSLPFSAEMDQPLTLITLTNKSSGGVADFILSDSMNVTPVFRAQTFGLGNAGVFRTLNLLNYSAAIYAESLEGSSVFATSVSASSPTVHAQNLGTSTALSAYAFMGNGIFARNYSPRFYTLWAQNDSSGPAIGALSKKGFALYAENYSDSSSTIYAINRGNSTTLYSGASGGNAMYAENSSASYYTIWAQNNSTGPTLGLNATAGNTLYAHNASDSKSTIMASNDGSYTTIGALATTGNALYALNTGSSSSAIFAKNNNSNGTSAIYAENQGLYPAVYGVNLRTTGDRSGGYFEAGADYAWVAANFTGTSYKIVGTGSVSTIVETPDKKKVTMFCSESPEILLTDYGIGQLIEGKIHISLDPVFTSNIVVDGDNPMKVFIQLEGECNGVFVTNKSAAGFDVVELNGGTSDTQFSWSVVANRSDEKDSDGRVVSKNAGVRYPPAPVRTSVE